VLPDDFAALVRSRHSVRDFRPDPVPDETLDAILDDARHAPSWSNTRPYCLAVATGAQRDRLSSAYLQALEASFGLYRREPVAVAKGLLLRQGFPDGDFRTWVPYPSELRERSRTVGHALYEHLGIARGDRPAREAQIRRNCEFFGAPAVLFLFVHARMLPFSAHDAGLMLQTLMLSARSRGVGSCALGVLATWRGPVDAEFEIPKQYKLVTGLALGYASEEHVNDFRAEHPPVTLLPSRSAGRPE